MNKIWILAILTLSFTFLALLKIESVNSLGSFYRGAPTIKLGHFRIAIEKANKRDKELLKLWESILTGRSAPLPKMMKENFSTLGLSHVFTPSGFHLSSILAPLLKVCRQKSAQMVILTIIGLSLLFLPGFAALKRMAFIKQCQLLLRLKVGFAVALILDCLFGTFQTGALGFTYSFLFLGLIYSGAEGLVLIVWFFLAQMMIGYFNGEDISLLLLIFSPLLNLGFALALPCLFIFSWPLSSWQLEAGLGILRFLKTAIEDIAGIVTSYPTIEVNAMTIVLVALILTMRWKSVAIVLLVFSGSLNLDKQKQPSMPLHEYVGEGKCRENLVRGIWWKNCSPRGRSSSKKT